MAANTAALVGHYGGDEVHALSAWTSTRREIDDDRRARMGDLLAFLAREGHHTPFEKSLLHFVVRCDTATHIQLLKHRVGVSINGESARYKQLRALSGYVPADWPEGLRDRLEAFYQSACAEYEAVLEELEQQIGRKRAKESARFFLPYANQLTLDVSFNFRSFMHFYGLRAAPDAQAEIQALAEQMRELVRQTGDFDLSLAAWSGA